MNTATSSELLDLLNRALARELQVSVQYMLQHAIGAGHEPGPRGKAPAAKRGKFIASHSPVGFPGATLKKVAVTEMRHAEAIAERIVHLAGEPTSEPDAITVGVTAEEMLEIDREAEQGAIQLYQQIIEVAGRAQDEVTLTLFRRILADEEKHHRMFSDLLETR